MKYSVITKNTVATEYVVEAGSKQEALEKFYDLEYESAKDRPDYEVNSEEEVLEVTLITKAA